jgi:hypothetical protein
MSIASQPRSERQSDSKRFAGLVACVALALAWPAAAAVSFAGYEWQVRDGTGGPGPNTFSAQNVSVDAEGHLHLRIVKRQGKWSCAEVFLDQRFGFGSYEFELLGRPDQFDDNVVLGLFNYTVPEVGPDGTNEIDIEFATWGGAQAEHGNYAVWPAIAGPGPATHSFDTTLKTDRSLHRFDWGSGSVSFTSLELYGDDGARLVHSWAYAPLSPLPLVPQQPIPVHINLWLFQGNAPTDGQDAEIVLVDFRYVEAPMFANDFE